MIPNEIVIFVRSTLRQLNAAPRATLPHYTDGLLDVVPLAGVRDANSCYQDPDYILAVLHNLIFIPSTSIVLIYGMLPGMLLLLGLAISQEGPLCLGGLL